MITAELLQIIAACNEHGVDSIQVGDIHIVFKGGRKALEAVGISPASPLGQFAQEAAAFDNWNQELPDQLKAQIAAMPVEDK